MPTSSRPAPSLRRLPQRVVRPAVRGAVRPIRPVQQRLYRSLVDRGRQHLGARRLGAARRSFAWARRVRSTPPDAWSGLARTAWEAGDSAAAARYGREVLRRSTEPGEARFVLAAALTGLGRGQDAADVWARVRADDVPVDVSDHLLVDVAEPALTALAAADRWDAVLALARRLPASTGATFELLALEGLGRHDELRALLVDRSARLDPAARARIWCGLALGDGQVARAWWWLRRCADALQPTELIRFGLRFADAGSPAHRRAAEELALTALDAGRVPPGPTVMRGVIERRLQARDIQGAQAWLDAARAVHTAEPGWEELEQRVNGVTPTPSERVAALRRDLEAAEVSVGRRVAALAALVDAGDEEHVAPLTTALMDDAPDDPRVLALHHAALQSADADAAAALLHDLRARASRSDVAATQALIRVEAAAGDVLSAADRFDGLSDTDVTSAEAMLVARRLRAEGELSRAAGVVERLLRVRPESGRRTHDLLDLIEQQRRHLVAPHPRAPSRVGVVRPVPGRVLHVVGKSLPQVTSGYTIRTASVVQAQAQHGIDPYVLTEPGFPWSTGTRTATVHERVDGIPHRRVPMLDPALDEVDLVADAARSVRPAVLHAASDFRNAERAAALADAFEIPLVYEVRGIWQETQVSKRTERFRESESYRLRHEREVASVLRADHVVTLSRTLHRELASWGVPDDRITIVPNAVDVDRFPVQTSRNATLAERWGIAPHEVVVGYISSLVAYEGIEYLLRAVAELRSRGVAVRALVVGDGESRRALEAEAAALDLGDAAIFTGRVPHDAVLGYYGLIDVFVVPRTNDRVCHLVTPLKPYEAMSTGRALVVSGVDALREIVDEGQTGLVFEPEDASGLADVLQRLVEDEALRHTLGDRAAQVVRERHTWRANAERYVDVYRGLGVM